MKKTLSIVIISFLFSFGAFAQNQAVRWPISTSIPETARHEIVQTILYGGGTTVTFRLDKYSGRVFQLGSCPKNAFVGTFLCWKEMTVIDLPKASGDIPRFQIFMGGDRERYVFLINTGTGQTWQHGVEAADKWTPLLETVYLPQSLNP